MVNPRPQAKTKRFYAFIVFWEGDPPFLSDGFRTRGDAALAMERYANEERKTGPIFPIDAPMPRGEK